MTETITLAGTVWERWTDISPKWRRRTMRGEDMLSVTTQPDANGHYTWYWMRTLAPNVTADVYGREDTLELAAQVAMDYQPQEDILAIGDAHLTWLCLPGACGLRWIAAVNGEECTVDTTQDSAYRWSRRSALLAGFPFGENAALAGTAKTATDAMVACLQAPQRFRAACAAVGARLIAVAARGDLA